MTSLRVAPHHQCRPHSCWPSRLGWGVACGLAVYLLYMHSSFFVERGTMWGLWRKQWEQDWKAERDALRAACAPLPPMTEQTRYGQRWQKTRRPEQSR